MNRIILLLVSIITFPVVSMGQNLDSTHTHIDSVHINYVSLCDNLLDIDIVITGKMISFSKSNDYRRNPFYHTSNKDTIAVLKECIEMLLNTNPVYDTNEVIIDDCRPYMKITFYCGTNVYQKHYYHYYDALFPFAYTELYHMILSTITTQRKK